MMLARSTIPKHPVKPRRPHPSAGSIAHPISSRYRRKAASSNPATISKNGFTSLLTCPRSWASGEMVTSTFST